MSSQAQHDLYADDVDVQQSPDVRGTGTDGVAPLRRIAAERLAAHRSKRGVAEPQAAVQYAAPTVSESARRAREAVAARYRQSPSYRDVLAAQAEQAVSVAAALPEVVVVPVVEPVMELAPSPVEVVVAPVAVAAVVAPNFADSFTANGAEEDFAWLTEGRPAAVISAAVCVVEPEPISMLEGALQVRPYEELPQFTTPPAPARAQSSGRADEIEGLDEEIAFRLAPEFDDHLIEPLPIQANIIEFPRQLVAARKARPRLAEGPLRDDDIQESRGTIEPAQAEAPEFQMRIFEVEPLASDLLFNETRTTAQGAVVDEPAVPEWQHLVLDAAVEEDEAPSWAPIPEPEMPTIAAHNAAAPLPVASLELRFMSAAVDAICVGIAFVAFAAVAGWIGGQQLRAVPLRTLGVLSVGLLALLSVFYQGLFFSLSRSTPGMFYANLVFRTLAGREPSRRLMRRRVGANVIAVLPLGLGLLWSVVDKRNLGWNDRISGVFLREF